MADYTDGTDVIETDDANREVDSIIEFDEANGEVDSVEIEAIEEANGEIDDTVIEIDEGNGEGENIFLRNKKSQYTVTEKIKFAKVIVEYKRNYDEELKQLNGKTRYSDRLKRHVKVLPPQGFIAKAVRTFYSDLKSKKNDDTEFKKAVKFGKRCHEEFLSGTLEGVPLKRFRSSGAGRKQKAVDVRQALFAWFIDIRGSLKGRLPIKIFKSKCKNLYDEWLSQQEEPVPPEEQLKFTKPWIKGWMNEYNISLRKPNKRFAIKKEDRIQRLEEYLRNIWIVRKYFLDKFGKEPVIINGDQMPLHRNESSTKKTLNFKGESTYVKENYMLSRERITVFTQVSSDPSVNLLPEFVFKGKGTRTTINAPDGIHFQWAPKGSYRIEQMLQTIKNLPNRYNIFTEKDVAIYVLDDYSVHLMPEVKKALFKKGYVLVVIGGGITGDIQMNDTHYHAPLKAEYRDEEMCLMLQQLEVAPDKIPSPSRDQMISMLLAAWNQTNVDNVGAFKSLFVTTKFDGSEDYLVSDKLFRLIGPAMLNFREKLLQEEPIKTLAELVKKITPPKGVKRNFNNSEGSELLDCAGEEIVCDEELVNIDSGVDDEMEVEQCEDQMHEEAGSSISDQPLVTRNYQSNQTALAQLETDDPDIKIDSAFLDDMFGVFDSYATSILFTPYMSQFKATYERARRSVKKRIKHTRKSRLEQTSNAIDDQSVLLESDAGVLLEPDREVHEVVTTGLDEECADDDNNEPAELVASGNEPGDREDVVAEVEVDAVDPRVGEYWIMQNGQHNLYAVVVEPNPVMVKYFVQKADHYRLNDSRFEASMGDFVKRVTHEPEIIPVGQNRIYYRF